MELDQRKLKILGAIVEEYTRTGEPVGSKRLSELLDVAVSPATIRNDMAALFEMGLLEQPHTSAGRVPSHLGYRLYLDRLMRPRPLSEREKAEIESLFNIMNPDPDRLLSDAAKALAAYTRCATFTTTSTPDSVRVSKIELIPATDTTVVIMVIATNGVIKNKICKVSFQVTRKICEFFTSFVNSRLQGKSLGEISSLYINSISVSLGEYAPLLNHLLSSVYELCKEIYDGQFYMGGQTNLLSYREMGDMVGDLLLFLENRREVLDLIPPEPCDVKVVIGKENSRMELSSSSFLVAKYDIDGYRCGAMGIIGPVRLDYSRAIPRLEYFAQTLGNLLSETFRQQRPKGE